MGTECQKMETRMDIYEHTKGYKEPEWVSYMNNEVKKGNSLTVGEKTMLDSYNHNQYAPDQVHYIRRAIVEDTVISEEQRFFLESYEQDPLAPEWIHNIKSAIKRGVANEKQIKNLLKYQEERASLMNACIREVEQASEEARISLGNGK